MKIRKSPSFQNHDAASSVRQRKDVYAGQVCRRIKYKDEESRWSPSQKSCGWFCAGWRNPLFSLVTIVTLPVGIGANSAIFSIINGVLLKPLPFPEPERLLGVWHAARGMGFEEVNQGPAFHLTYREENRVFEDIGMWDNTSLSVTGLAEPEEVEGLRVTESIIPHFGGEARNRPVLYRRRRFPWFARNRHSHLPFLAKKIWRRHGRCGPANDD